MWKEAVNFAKQLFSLTRDVQQNKEDIKELRSEVKQLRQEFNELTRVVERLVVEWRHDRERAEAERRVLLLEIENRFLRYERGLPPSPKPEDTNP